MTSYPCNKYEQITPSYLLRQHLHGTGSIWNQYEIGTDKPCAYTDLVDPVRIGSSIWYQMGSSTYEGDPMWNCTVPVQNRSRVNKVGPIPNGLEQIRSCVNVAYVLMAELVRFDWPQVSTNPCRCSWLPRQTCDKSVVHCQKLEEELQKNSTIFLCINMLSNQHKSSACKALRLVPDWDHQSTAQFLVHHWY